MIMCIVRSSNGFFFAMAYEIQFSSYVILLKHRFTILNGLIRQKNLAENLHKSTAQKNTITIVKLWQNALQLNNLRNL
jgi:hypothetical protein